MNHPTSENPQEQTEAGALSESDRYELLANYRRRQTIAVLAEQDGAISLDELARRIDEHETGEVESAGSEDAVIGLHHIHLPKLDDIGLVDYDPESNNVEPHLEEFEPQIV